MILKRMNILLPITAGIMVGIIGLIYEYSIMRLAYTMLIVLFAFFVIASVLQKIITKNINEAFNEEQADILSEELDKASKNEAAAEGTESPISPESNDNNA